uniref:JmjC domain-containing protein n=1 Tax=Globodera pallida TaxID=36090 RepID=A0A183CN83_GLOPA
MVSTITQLTGELRLIVSLLFVIFFFKFRIAEGSKSDEAGAGEGEDDDGGWRVIGEHAIALEGPCTIERVGGDGLTEKDFLRRYANSKPVIIEGVRNGWLRKRCRREAMLAEWHAVPVVLTSANTYSYKKVETTFGDYVQRLLRAQNLSTLGNETLYLFGDIDQTLWKPLLDDYIRPRWTIPGYGQALSFGVAAVGTGVPFHFHGPGFGEVIFGAKRWFLYPEHRRPRWDPDKSTLQWYSQVLPTVSVKERPLDCLLKPGELIYFPDKWWHATLNAKTSVFISTFLSPLNGRNVHEMNEL